uniref:Decapping nuclease n=1 Tax=Pipistrellus kuhlii TaxID=59472 RepID=A0A7J7YL86_PIPKU|nr:decapping exoribonuclease [Pipistrellus kuhlii]
MEPGGTKRGAGEVAAAEPRSKLPRPAPSLPTAAALYAGPFPFYRRPSQLGCFSLDAQRRYRGDARALRYYRPPANGQRPDFDLRDGYPERYRPRDEEAREGLDHLLRWLLEHRGGLEGHKLLKWWAQSFLLGVPSVVAGFRNPEGFVCSLKTFPTMQMFEHVRNDRDGWNPSVCMNFCAAFLSFAQNTVVQDDPRLVHLFSWEPGGPVTVSVHRDAPPVFLPTWYVEAMTQELPPPPHDTGP